MDYPNSHVAHVGHHRHHNRRDDYDDDNNATYPPPPPPHMESQNYPPPPSYGGAYDPSYAPPPSYGGAYEPSYAPPPSYGGDYPPPPQQHSYDHQSSSHHEGGPPYPPHSESQNYPPPPQQHSYDHQTSSHHEDGPLTHHRFQPHVPSFIGSHFHHGSENHGSSTHGSYGGGPDGPGPELGSLENKPSHKIHCKAGGERYAVGIRDGKVVLTHPDTSDLTQHWCKDEKYSTKVKDKDGYPSFILVNKGTAQAVKHSVSCHPVQLAPYQPDAFDESVLWTEGKDVGSGFRTIRTVNNVRLVMDAWNADKDHGGIHDGTLIALYETWKGDNQNQQWKFVRH